MPLGLKYYHTCINCEGVNTDNRNLKGLPCEKCLPKVPKDFEKTLKLNGKLQKLSTYIKFQKSFEDFKKFFGEKVGSTLNGYQRIWARRVINLKSFTMVAPTGVGKTTFGITISLWLSKQKKKSILILPTISLVKQVVDKLKRFESNVRLLFYLSNMKKDDKKMFEKCFEEDDYDILVVSTQFISKRRESLKDKYFDFVFVDDVDSVLKSSKNIETIISLTGVSEEILKETIEKIKKGEKPVFGNTPHGILVISSATAKPKGLKPLLFRYIFNFNLGRATYLSRNITHVRIKEKNLKQLIDILKILKDGIVIYVSNEEEGKYLEGKLKEKGFKIGTSWEKFDENFERFRNKDLNILIGISSYYGKLVRGIDLPERIKFSIFWGLPKFKLKDEDLIIPDFYTYVQATGRTSRLLKGNLVKGLSIVFEENDDLYEKLLSRLVWFSDEEFFDFNEIDLDKLIKEVEESRMLVLDTIPESKSRLIVVESPTKAETIAKFFGISSVRQMNGLFAFETVTKDGLVILTATRGHTFDLVTRNGYHGIEIKNEKFVPVYNTLKRCKNCGYQFVDDTETCPKCDSREIDNKVEIIKSLRELAMEVDEILIASDPDVEGEKIAYDVVQFLYPVNRNIKRMEMHEITRTGFRNGLEEPRKLREDLVKSQVVRRVGDRWIGFELSQKLQKHFKKLLSAGRVQSTVLGWIIKREEDYKKNVKTFTLFSFNNGLKIELEGKQKDVKISIIETFEDTINPLPPFNTSTILSEISKKYRLSVNYIMEILQELFEKGFITYHRTDSIRVSLNGQKIAEKYLKSKKMENIFKARSWSDEGAHEAIRPVKPIDPEELKEMMEERLITISKKHLLIYKEIFNRFLASQSREVKVKKAKLLIETETVKKEEEIVTEILESGWNIFQPIKVISKMEEAKVVEKRTFKKHTVSLFTQSTLIEEMKSRNIGRPSTYAKIISVLFERKYIIEDKFNRILPTNLGKMVFEYLSKNYQKFITEETTRNLELIMDEVERGEREYQMVLKEMYEEIRGGGYE
ncbi:reverse gyrase [Thermosipho atlanticus]|uniref:Reverse gyrase n=1 Tax=Thermosipho atlanticus DSM 15807 TaxID=1123380 RepID=A0A1M5SN28_9BACT|nr:reverse gyrase [Thermosipho atlanticus]SHH39927.1 Reverse gyrase [Thermosipho atlanticus DSM 15807]